MSLPEDLRRVAGLRLDLELPGRRAAARGDRELRIAGTVLEADRVLRALRGVDQRGARGGLRIARVLLVAGHDHDEVHVGERAGDLQRLERGDHDDVAALHVDDAGALRGLVVDALELLERAVALEHGVEVADEQHPRTLAGMIRDQVAGALERRAVHPGRLEPERVELLAEEVPDRADAGEVVRAAVDVDRPSRAARAPRRCRRRRRTRSRARGAESCDDLRECQQREAEDRQRMPTILVHYLDVADGLDLVAEALVDAGGRERCPRTR